MDTANFLGCRKHNLATQALLIFSALALLVGCTNKPKSDDDLAQPFVANKEWFSVLASSYLEGHVTCPSKNDPDICVLSDSSAAISHLRKDAHIQSVYIKRNRAGDNGIWIPVQSYGVMSTSSSTRGYVYLESSPAVTVSSTFSNDQKGSHYKPLEGRWYLFIVN